MGQGVFFPVNRLWILGVPCHTFPTFSASYNVPARTFDRLFLIPPSKSACMDRDCADACVLSCVSVQAALLVARTRYIRWCTLSSALLVLHHSASRSHQAFHFFSSGKNHPLRLGRWRMRREIPHSSAHQCPGQVLRLRVSVQPPRAAFLNPKVQYRRAA